MTFFLYLQTLDNNKQCYFCSLVLLNMELPKEHLEGLRLCASLSDKSFKALIRRALLDGSDPSKREHVSCE